MWRTLPALGLLLKKCEKVALQTVIATIVQRKKVTLLVKIMNM